MKTNAQYLLSFIMIQKYMIYAEPVTVTVQTDLGKADFLNSIFFSCYNLSHLWINLNITIYNHLMGVLRSLCVMRRKSTSCCPPWMSPMLTAMLLGHHFHWNAEAHCCKHTPSITK